MKRILCMTLLFVMACGSGEIPVQPEPIGSGEPLDAGGSEVGNDAVTAAFRSLVKGTCTKAFDCCAASTARAISGLVAREECESDALQGFSSVTIQGLEVALAAGTIRIDESAASLCEQAIADLTCGEWTSLDPVRLEASGCREAIEPMLDENVQCTADFECRSQACIETSDGVSRCATLKDAGEPCDPGEGELCKPGNYCDNFDARRCVALLEDGVQCASAFDCISGICEPGPRGTNECTPPSGVCEDSPAE